MNLENINRTANYIEKYPYAFNMSSYDKCVAGCTLAMLGVMSYDVAGTFSTAEKHLGIAEEQARQLFFMRMDGLWGPKYALWA